MSLKWEWCSKDRFWRFACVLDAVTCCASLALLHHRPWRCARDGTWANTSVHFAHHHQAVDWSDWPEWVVGRYLRSSDLFWIHLLRSQLFVYFCTTTLKPPKHVHHRSWKVRLQKTPRLCNLYLFVQSPTLPVSARLSYAEGVLVTHHISLYFASSWHTDFLFSFLIGQICTTLP